MLKKIVSKRTFNQILITIFITLLSILISVGIVSYYIQPFSIDSLKVSVIIPAVVAPISTFIVFKLYNKATDRIDELEYSKTAHIILGGLALKSKSFVVFIRDQPEFNKKDLDKLKVFLGYSHDDIFDIKDFKRSLGNGFDEFYENLKSTDAKENIRIELIGKEGKSYVFNSYHVSSKIKNKRVYITYLIDVTDKTYTQNLLLKSISERDDLISNISHELKTPINAVVGFAEMALRDTDYEDIDIQKHKTNIRNLKRSADQLVDLINALLTLEKLEKGALKVSVSKTDLREMLSLVSVLHTNEYERKGLRFKCTVDDEIPKTVLLDSVKVSQVINNLVSNAIKYSHVGEISVDVKLSNQSSNLIIFSVSDQGQGIDESELESIFMPFSQSTARPNQHLKGTGLGLSICKQISEILNADLSVSSVINQGSTFTFTVPFKHLEVVDSVLVNERVRDYRFTSFVNVLVCEDNKFNADVVQRVLVDAGANVKIAVNGLQALDLCYIEDFDIILMDIQMPIMNGYDASKNIKKLSRYKDIPIFALTAGSLDQHRALAINSGMTDLIPKPFEIGDFLRTISESTGVKLELAVSNNISKSIKIGEINLLRAIELWGSEMVFNKALAEFMGEYASFRDEFLTLELELLVSRAHSLKGAAGFVGLDNYSKFMGKVEKALKKSDSRNEFYEEFCQLHDAVFSDIQQYLSKANTQPNNS